MAREVITWMPPSRPMDVTMTTLTSDQPSA
jgi:hypothetical protein